MDEFKDLLQAAPFLLQYLIYIKQITIAKNITIVKKRKTVYENLAKLLRKLGKYIIKKKITR